MKHNKLWISLFLPILATSVILPVALLATSCSSTNSLNNGKVSVATKTIINNADIKTYCDQTTNNTVIISADKTYDDMTTDSSSFLTYLLGQIKSKNVPGCSELTSDDIESFALLPDTRTYTNIGNWSTNVNRYHIILELSNNSKFASDEVDPIQYSPVSQINAKFIIDIPATWAAYSGTYTTGLPSSHFPANKKTTAFYTYTDTVSSVYEGQTYPIINNSLTFTNNKSIIVSFAANLSTNDTYTEGYQIPTVNMSRIPSSPKDYFSSNAAVETTKGWKFTAQNDVQNIQYSNPGGEPWLIGFTVGSDSFNVAISDYYQQYDQLNKYGAHGFDANYVPKNALAFNWQDVDYSGVGNDDAWRCAQAYFEPTSDTALTPTDWNDQTLLDWYNHNVTPGFIARNIFFNFWYYANLLYGQSASNVITGMNMTYDSISCQKSGNVKQNEEVKGFDNTNLLKGNALYSVNIKNLQIHVTNSDGSNFDGITINTKKPVSIATIYSSGTATGGPENTIGASNNYFKKFHPNAAVAITANDYDEYLPMLVLGSLDDDKLMKTNTEQNIDVKCSSEYTSFTGTWNAFPFMLDYNFWPDNHFSTINDRIVCPFPQLSTDGADIYPA